jgi:hypothetical protein
MFFEFGTLFPSHLLAVSKQRELEGKMDLSMVAAAAADAADAADVSVLAVHL